MLYTENISTLFFYLLTCSGLVELTNGLVEPLTLCETQNPVAVRELSGGTIQHVQKRAGDPADECQLVLTGFSSSAYVSLPGVVEKSKLHPCPDRSAEIIINKVQHCVLASDKGAIIPLTDGTLTLKLVNQRVANFTLNYYSNVDICNIADSVITIPRNAAYDQLSCIITNVDARRPMCSTVIKNLLDRAVIVELLYTTSDNGEAFNEFEITKANPRIFRKPRDELMITYSQGKSSSFEYTIKLTVLTCGEAPQVQNTTSDQRNVAIDSSTAFWFYGSQVNYICNEKCYEFQDLSSVTCQLNFATQSLEWSNISDIKCIPVSLKNISNTEVTRTRDNLTATYQCIAGYKVPAGPENITVTCSSPDPDTVRWTWNDTDTKLNCMRVEMETSQDSPISLIVGSVLGITVLICLMVIVAVAIRRRRSRQSSPSSDIYQSTNVNLQNVDDNHVYARPEEIVYYVNGHMEDEDTNLSPYLQPVRGALPPPAVYEEMNAHIYNNT